jgi:retron-type reverse transcriptase
MKIKIVDGFKKIVATENLLEAWREFLPGKRKKRDVQEFGMRLMDNLFALNYDLAHHTYRHGGYQAFNISDPKPRNIHKASVRDRLLHHAIYRQLYPFFDRTFIPDSFSCRDRKGTHRAMNRFRKFYRVVSKNDKRQCWVLKCDIRKFFANIDHDTLLEIIGGYTSDQNLLRLIKEIVDSFSVRPGVGLPLGNLTSQLFVNIYMNEFDQFVKHKLKAKYYIRYADDFVFLSPNREWLEIILPEIRNFLTNRLHLELHPNKVSIATFASGVDFLGWVHFPDHRVLRTTTKWRMLKRIEANPAPATIASYRGLLTHGNAYQIGKRF